MTIFDALKVHAPQDQGFEYRLEVLENEMPNAFAMPGGQMVILTGLLEILDTPEEVAGVLAHELAHVYRRHSLKRLLQATGLITLGQIAMGDVAGAAGMLAGAAGMAALHYSREAEEDADRQGTELMHRAGIDPENLAEAFRKLQAHQDAMLAQSAPKMSRAMRRRSLRAFNKKQSRKSLQRMKPVPKQRRMSSTSVRPSATGCHRIRNSRAG